MGAKKQTIGYHYMFDILFGLCRGPINDLREIMVADKTAWEGPLCDGDVQAIKKPDLFGGEKKEGGIQGPFRLLLGAPDQVLPGVGSANCGKGGPLDGVRSLPAVKTAIGEDDVSEFRGVTMLWFSGLVSSMNPYPKEWSFRARRYSAGWFNDEPWYPVKSAIFLADGAIHAMNPAHIIYQCLTDPIWGRGLPAFLIDEPSFIYAANKLCEEGFGLCFNWQRKEEVDIFIETVQKHIGSVLYPDPETGKIVLRLIRADYDAATLPHFTPTTGLLDIKQEDSTSQDEVFNEIIGSGRDPIKNEDFQVRVHNLAARQSMGGPNTKDEDFSGIPTRDLMARVIQRELKMYAAGLKKFEVVLDRSGWALRPGMCFKVSDDRRGIGNIVLRVGEITDQSFKDGRVTVKAMQDVYGLPLTSFTTPTEPTWTPPATDAIPPTARRLVEANYRDMVLRRDPATLATFDPTDAFFGAVALSPDPVMYEYMLATRAAGETDFDDDTIGPFTGAATLVDPITALQTTFEITGETDFAEDLEGQVVLIGDEQMKLVDYIPDTHMVTVVRGVADTIPSAHAAATTLWTIDDDFVSDQRTYAAGETVEAYVLTRTSSDTLDPELTTMDTLDLVGRQGRPYPPADVTVDGDSIYALDNIEYPEPLVEWAHRDRVLQADQAVGYFEASVGPEPGVTYTIRIYDPDVDPDAVIRTTTGIAGPSWTYDAAMQAADGSPFSVYIEIESVRDGVASYVTQRFLVPLQSGYGLGYGLNYGGA